MNTRRQKDGDPMLRINLQSYFEETRNKMALPQRVVLSNVTLPAAVVAPAAGITVYSGGRRNAHRNFLAAKSQARERGKAAWPVYVSILVREPPLTRLTLTDMPSADLVDLSRMGRRMEQFIQQQWDMIAQEDGLPAETLYSDSRQFVTRIPQRLETLIRRTPALWRVRAVTYNVTDTEGELTKVTTVFSRDLIESATTPAGPISLELPQRLTVGLNLPAVERRHRAREPLEGTGSGRLLLA